MVARVAISPLVPDMVDAFGVSKSAIGVAFTGMWAAYALLQFPSGLLGERYGERTVVVTALTLTGLGSVGFAMAPSYLGFLFATAFLGFGTGLYFSVATSVLTRLAENRGQPLGLHSAGGPIAGIVAPVAAVQVAERFGWRVGLLLGATVAFPTVLLYVRTIRPAEPSRPDTSLRNRLRPAQLRQLFADTRIVFTTAIAVLGYSSGRRGPPSSRPFSSSTAGWQPARRVSSTVLSSRSPRSGSRCSVGYRISYRATASS